VKIPLRFLLVAWLAISVVASIPLNRAHWGAADGFHGTGWPFPSVIWDRLPQRSGLVDFPNPLAPFYNIAAVFFAGALPLILVWAVIRVWRARALRG
jgi:hypothetical protein